MQAISPAIVRSTASPPASGACTRHGVPTWHEVRGEFDDALDTLRATLGPRDAMTTTSRQALEKFEGLARALTPQDSVHAKFDLRQSLWALRQSYERAAQGNPPLETRRAYERLRSVCLDNTWERTLRAFPREHHGVRPRISIVPNYDRVSARVQRGGCPTQEGADWLTSVGRVGTVIDLTTDRDTPWAPVEWHNATHYRVPVTDYKAPTDAQLDHLIDLIDQAKDNVYIHCKAGIGRSGVVVACWRVTQGWSADEAIAAEALNSYDANLSQAQAVRDFAARWQAGKAAQR